MKKSIERNCNYCSKSYLTTAITRWHIKNGRGKFCSRLCNSLSQKKDKIAVNCQFCNKSYLVIPSRVPKTKYCSYACGVTVSIGPEGFWKGKKRPDLKNTNAAKFMFKKGVGPWNKGLEGFLAGEINYHWKGGKPSCLDCGKKLSGYAPKRCYPCSVEAQVGENGSNWQGGLTKLNYSLRHSRDYMLFRKTVLERDNYICINCGSKENLQVDHIKPFSLFPELRLDTTNGRTLCVLCHKKTPTWGGKATSSKEVLSYA